MKNICRTILLHDEFIPAIVGKREWKYQVLGHHDGMTVEDAVELNGSGSFEKLFQMNIKYEGWKADYSTQCFYGFHSNADKEKEFWDIETPFVFLSFLQFNERDICNYQKYLESEQYIQNSKVEIATEYDVESIHTLAYFAMDASDVILVIKCDRCENGAAMINHLHHDLKKNHPFTIRNSYSVLALDRQYIEDPSKTKNIEENIGLLELRIIERKSGSIDGLYQQLRSLIVSQNPECQVERKALLGTEDEAIIIKSMPWKDLLPLYRTETGILCNANECAKVYANAISTKLFHFIAEYETIISEGTWSANDYAPLCDYLHEKVALLYEGKRNNNSLAEYKNLMVLVNAFRKVENSWHNGAAFLDYSFFMNFFPFAAFVVLHEVNCKNQYGYYNFINRLRLCTQNFTKPNRVFSQVADFNVRYFDIPSKFLAFYNAYIYQVKDLLNTREDRKYEFLVSPGLDNKVAVEEMYARTIDRIHLFSVEIPEAQMYMMKLMLIILGHEVSHFVGTDLRQRDKRFESVIKISSHMAVLAIRNYIEYVAVFEKECLLDEELWGMIEENLNEELEYCLKRYQDIKYLKVAYFDPKGLTEEQLENQRGFYKAYFQHTEVLKKILYTALNDILDLNENILFEEIIWKSFDDAVKKGRSKYEERDIYYAEHKGELSRCINSFIGKKGEKTDYLTVSNGIEHMMCLLEECYADMICILTLELSLKDYLYSIIESLDSSGFDMEDIYDKIMLARIAIVLSVLSYDMKDRGNRENDFRWSDDEFKKLNDDGRVLGLYKMAEGFVKNFIKDQRPISLDERIKDAQTLICDGQILREVISYLLKCRESYSLLIKSEKKMRVRKMFLLSHETDVNKLFAGISDILGKYEKKIYNDIPEWIEKEKRKRKCNR